MTAAGMLLLELAAEGCGAPSDTLVKLFNPDPVSTLRYLHYPPRQGPLPEEALDPTDSKSSGSQNTPLRHIPSS